VPFQDQPLYVNTVLKTTNPQEVKQVIDLLVEQQGCLAPEEQTVHDESLLFKDPDFGPEANYNPIYFSNDIDEKSALELEFSLKKV